ncbi:hypothetical protein F2P79_000970 [Pimephales promelas]|nr:hypothetical protein F2P79_000970 [Pimephales promelas]
MVARVFNGVAPWLKSKGSEDCGNRRDSEATDRCDLSAVKYRIIITAGEATEQARGGKDETRPIIGEV